MWGKGLFCLYFAVVIYIFARCNMKNIRIRTTVSIINLKNYYYEKRISYDAPVCSDGHGRKHDVLGSDT